MKIWFSVEGFILSKCGRMIERIIDRVWYEFSRRLGFLYVLFECGRYLRSYFRRLYSSARETSKEKIDPYEMFGMGLKFCVTKDGELELMIGLTHTIRLKFIYGLLMRGKDKALWFWSYVVEFIKDARRKLVKVSRLIKYKEKGVIPLMEPIFPRVRKEKRR